jgi:hypothetical protein
MAGLETLLASYLRYLPVPESWAADRGQQIFTGAEHDDLTHPRHARRASRLCRRNPCWATLRSRGVTYHRPVLAILACVPARTDGRSECGGARARHAPIARASGPPEAASRTYTLIVTDTSPLITLALAGELDLLLRLGTTPGAW